MCELPYYDRNQGTILEKINNEPKAVNDLYYKSFSLALSGRNLFIYILFTQLDLHYSRSPSFVCLSPSFLFSFFLSLSLPFFLSFFINAFINAIYVFQYPDQGWQTVIIHELWTVKSNEYAAAQSIKMEFINLPVSRNVTGVTGGDTQMYPHSAPTRNEMREPSLSSPFVVRSERMALFMASSRVAWVDRGIYMEYYAIDDQI